MTKKQIRLAVPVDTDGINRSQVLTNTGSAHIRCRKAVELAAKNLELGGSDESVRSEIRRLLIESIDALSTALIALDYRGSDYYD